MITARTDRFLMQRRSKGLPRSHSSFVLKIASIRDNGMLVVISEKAYSSFVLRIRWLCCSLRKTRGSPLKTKIEGYDLLLILGIKEDLCKGSRDGDLGGLGTYSLH